MPGIVEQSFYFRKPGEKNVILQKSPTDQSWPAWIEETQLFQSAVKAGLIKQREIKAAAVESESPDIEQGHEEVDRPRRGRPPKRV